MRRTDEKRAPGSIFSGDVITSRVDGRTNGDHCWSLITLPYGCVWPFIGAMLRKTADILCCRVAGGCVPGGQDVSSSSSSSSKTDHVEETATGIVGSVGGGGDAGRPRRRQLGLASAAALGVPVSSTAKSSPGGAAQPRSSDYASASAGK